MLPPPHNASAPADAPAADALTSTRRDSTTKPQPAADPLPTPPPTVTAQRADLAEVSKLRHRLLKLILENQHRREQQRQRGLTVRGAG